MSKVNNTGSYTIPAGVTGVFIQCWGGGGGGHEAGPGFNGPGGGGGAYAAAVVAVVPGDTLEWIWWTAPDSGGSEDGGAATVTLNGATEVCNADPGHCTAFPGTAGGPGGQAASCIGCYIVPGNDGGAGSFSGTPPGGVGGAGASPNGGAGGAGGNPGKGGTGSPQGGGGGGGSQGVAGNGGIGTPSAIRIWDNSDGSAICSSNLQPDLSILLDLGSPPPPPPPRTLRQTAFMM
jgi:hypothetical protein